MSYLLLKPGNALFVHGGQRCVMLGCQLVLQAGKIGLLEDISGLSEVGIRSSLEYIESHLILLKEGNLMATKAHGLIQTEEHDCRVSALWGLACSTLPVTM